MFHNISHIMYYAQVTMKQSGLNNRCQYNKIRSLLNYYSLTILKIIIIFLLIQYN